MLTKKENVDKALLDCPTIEKVFVVKRTSSDINMDKIEEMIRINLLIRSPEVSSSALTIDPLRSFTMSIAYALKRSATVRILT